VARQIVSVEMISGPGPHPGGVFGQSPRVIATLDDGGRITGPGKRLSVVLHQRPFGSARVRSRRYEMGRSIRNYFIA